MAVSGTAGEGTAEGAAVRTKKSVAAAMAAAVSGVHMAIVEAYLRQRDKGREGAGRERE